MKQPTIAETFWMYNQVQKWKESNPQYEPVYEERPDPESWSGFREVRVGTKETANYEERLKNERKRLAQIEIGDVQARAELKVISDLHYQSQMLKLELGKMEEADGVRSAAMIDAYQELRELRMSKSKNCNKSNQFYWVTVNPRPDVTLEELKKKVEKFTKKACHRACAYTYEQRASREEEMGHGLHAHILCMLKKPMRTNDVSRDDEKGWFNCFKDICGNSQHLWVTGHDTVKTAKSKMEYMRGNKRKDEDGAKKEKSEVDVVWRKANGLQPMYNAGPESMEVILDSL